MYVGRYFSIWKLDAITRGECTCMLTVIFQYGNLMLSHVAGVHVC